LKIKFLGASRQVTGSCYYLEAGGLRLLIECGLYQERDFLGRNWKPFPVSPQKIDYVLLTHVHLDHSGLTPKLIREGFSGDILTTSASNGMIPTVLLDSARIHEEDAAYKKKRHKKEGRKGPYPEIPLYTEEDVEKALPFFKNVPYEKEYSLNDLVTVRYCDAGHILGSAMLEIKVKENGSVRRVIFSGDIGQWDKPLVRDPSVFEQADYIVMESTYGDRNHKDPLDVEELLAQIIKETIKAGGNIIIPTFAIERAQELMYHLSRLEGQNRIPYLMMFLDSPMAVDITNVFRQYKGYLDEETQILFKEGRSPFHFPGLRLVRSVEESKRINSLRNPCIVMAGAGMCTGGRIKHHLKYNIIRPESTILFVGYQAEGTLGRKIVEKKETVRIHGRMYPLKARVEQIHGFSAHADQKALMKWLGHLKSPPERVFLTHGEEKSALALANKIKADLGWDAVVPNYLDDFDL
jgi:metallo-beta-lactamase family protein